MQGAIAAGNQITTEAGASVLADGGNAIDACIVAAFSAAVSEGPLTGPTGGGFLLAWFEGEATVLDCFFAAPSRPLGEMEEIVIDFGDASTQVFHVGAGSVAVPGLVAGLEEAHRLFGSIPWPELVQPAIELARAGLDTTDEQRFLHTILSGILERDEGGRRIYGTTGRIETNEFVATLELVRDTGSAALAELLPELAGDLARYKVASPEPLRTTIGGHTVLTTPGPSRGGAIVAAALERLTVAESLADRAQALRHGYASAPPLTVAGTTHISVIDADGNAAAFSSTLGLRVRDLSRRHATEQHARRARRGWGGRAASPARGSPSMMTPTLVLDDGRPRLALGSAGSVRLAGAIAQVADAVLRGIPVAEAIERPRIHVDGDDLHLEGGLDRARSGRLERRSLGGPQSLLRWRRRGRTARGRHTRGRRRPSPRRARNRRRVIC